MIDLSSSAAKIVALRREKGFTQEELSARLGVSAQAVSKWERGLSLPDVDLLLDLSGMLGVTINYILDKDAAGPPVAPNDSPPQSVYELAPEVIIQNKFSYGIILLQIGMDLIPLISEDFLKRISTFRRDTLHKKGVILPVVRIRDEVCLEPGQCVLKYAGAVKWEMTQDMKGDPEQARNEILERIFLTINSELHLFVNRHMVKLLVERLKIDMPFCVEGVVPDRISLTGLKVILKEMIQQGHSIADLPGIIETVDENLDASPETAELVRLCTAK